MLTDITWKLDAEIIGITALVVGDAAAFWSANNPSVFTVRAFRRKGGKEAETTKRDIRMGGMAGSGLALLVGVGGTAVTKSWWPLAGTLAILAFQWTVWEWAMANPHDDSENDIASQQNPTGGGRRVPGLGMISDS